MRKNGGWHPAIVWVGANDDGETIVRFERSWLQERMFDGNADVRYRSEWTAELKAGRRGAQAWGWKRWPDATKEELRSKKKKKKKKAVGNTRAENEKSSRKRRRDEGGDGGSNTSGASRKKAHLGEGKKQKKKKVKKKKKTSSAWQKLKKFR